MSVRTVADNPVLRSAGWLFADRGLQVLSLAVVNVCVIRALGVEQYGVFTVATSLLALVVILGDFGQVPVISALARGVAPRRGLLRLAGRLSSVGCVLALLVMLGAAWVFHQRASPSAALILIVSLALLAKPVTVVDQWFQASGANGVGARARLTSVLIGSGARVVVVVVHPSLVLLAAAVAGEAVLAAVLLQLAYRRNRGADPVPDAVPDPEPCPEARAVPTPTGGLPGEVVARVLREAWPLLLSGATIMLFMRGALVILAFLAPVAEVGAYGAAANMADALNILPYAVSAAALPVLVRSYTAHRARFEEQVQAVFCAMAVAGTLVAVVGVLAGPALAQLLYGDGFTRTGHALQVLFLCAPFAFVGVAQAAWTAGAGLQRETLLRTGIAAAAAVALNFALIPVWGAVGAAVATVVAHAWSGILGNLVMARTRPVARAQLRAFDPRVVAGCVRTERARRAVPA